MMEVNRWEGEQLRLLRPDESGLAMTGVGGNDIEELLEVKK